MRLKPTQRLIVIIGGLMLVAYTLLAVFVVLEEFKHIDDTIDNDIMNVSNVISTDQVIIDALANRSLTIDGHVAEYYEDVPELSLIEIVDSNLVRYSHINETYVGETYAGPDITDAFLGISYIRTSPSTIGEARKAFVPIFDGNLLVGVAIVEILVDDIEAIKLEKAMTLVGGFALGFVLSVVGLVGFSRKFRSELLGFQPNEIALLYAENKSVIEQLNEGLLSIDQDYVVTTANSMLFKMFELDADIVGKRVEDVFPYVDFKTILEEDLHVTNKYKKIQEGKYLMNAFPLYLGDRVIGATAVFRSHLEVDALIDQINGYRQIAEALRSQKHEFQNKLHVVLGLIKMKDYEQAETYIMEHVYSTNLASDYYTSRIKDDRILALFVGKEIQSKEYGASLLLTSDSYIGNQHMPISSDDIVLVLGNLIDNSLEAYQGKDIEDKRIVVDVFEDEDLIKLTVIDQAGGVDPTILDTMFQRGVSTKNGQSRGTGLSLVSEIVLLYGGEKQVYSSPEETKVEILLRKVIS